jgi:hypothetical protein
VCKHCYSAKILISLKSSRDNILYIDYFTFTMNNNENPSYINENGKRVSGAAAQQHAIKQNGGWQEHHEKFGESILKVHKYLSQKNNVYAELNEL